MNILNKFNKNSKELNPTLTKLMNWIKDREFFKRAEILKEAKKLDIKDRTLSDILNRFLDLKLIIKISHGVYSKK